MVSQLWLSPRILAERTGFERRLLQLKLRDFRDFPKKSLNRKLSIRIRNRSGPMTGDGVEDVLSQPVFSARRSDPVTSRMAWRKPSVLQTKLAHKSANYLRAISAAFSKFVGRQRRKERPRLYLSREFKNPFSTKAGSKGMMRSDPLGLGPVGIARIGLSAVGKIVFVVLRCSSPLDRRYRGN